MKMGKVYKKRVLAALLALLMSMSQTMPVFASEVPSNVVVATSIIEEDTSADVETVLEEGESEEISDTVSDDIAQKETEEDPDEIGLVSEEAGNDGETDYDYLNYTETADGKITITGAKGTSATGDLIIPETIEGKPVTKIADYAFGGKEFFTGKLVIPDSVTTIGDCAFLGCSGLTGSLTIPNSVQTIGKGAFRECSGFTGSLTIPNSVTTIGDYAFAFCSGFAGSLTIPNSVTTIGGAAFGGCSGFTGDLTIPDNVTTIGFSAFFECSGFTGSLTIPNSVTTIENYAFDGCSGFTGSLTIGSNVTTIGKAAFNNCSGFTGSLTIPGSVTTIGEYAFYGCSSFTGSLKIPDSVTKIGEFAFYECSGFTGSLTLPNSVITIGEYAFRECSGFTGSLTIGSNVTTIGKAAFNNCSGFTGSLTIPGSVTTIGNSAFEGCSSFTGSLKIPDSVTTIGEYAFYECSGFTKLTNNSAQTLPVSWFSSDDTECFTDANGTEYRSGNLPANGTYERKLKTLTGLSLDETDVTIKAFESKKLTATILPPNAYNKKITWSSSAPSIAKVDANGNVKGIKSGETVITATTEAGNFEATCTVTVEPFVYQNVKYELNEDGTQAIAVGYESEVSGDLTIADTIGGCPVTAIKECAFLGASNFTGNLTIGNSVKTIGEDAFQVCSGFTGSLTIGNSVETIGESAFYGCSGFTGSLTIPNSVTTIGEHAFEECSGFDGSLTIGNSVTTIERFAFRECSGFTGSLTIPNSVTTIGEHAFEECSGFDGSLTIGNSVTTIERFAFRECSGFTGSLTLGNSVTTIGDYAFSGCSGFTGDLVIPGSVTTIGEEAFAECSGFTGSLVIPDSVTTIGDKAFADCRGFDGSLTIPGSVTTVGESAFWNCSSFSSITNNSADNLDICDFWDDTDSNTVCFTDETGKEYSRNDTFSKGKFIRRIKPESVSLDKDSLSVYIGKTDTVSATVSPVNAYDKVTYSSSKPEIATVNNDGVITGVAKGETVITVTTVSGKKTANCTVTVKQRDKIGVSINGGVDKTVTYGDADFSLSKTLTGAGEGTGVWTWSSSNTDVATVNATTGLISIKNAGTTIIKAKYETEITEGEAEITLTVEKADMSTAEITLGKALTYNGSEQTQSVSGVVLNGKTVPTDSYTVTDNKVINAGSYTLTVTANADSNYTGSKTVSFSVAKLAVTPVVTVTGDYSFTGKAITPKFSVKYDGKDMPADEYMATLENNINAGTAKLTVTASQNGNYSFDPMTTEFAIAKAKALTLSDISKEQGYYVKDISATVNGLMPEDAGTLSYIAGEPQITKVNGSTTKISDFTVDESGKVSAAVTDGTAGDVITLPVTITSTNYADSTVNVTLTLTKQVEGLAVYGIEDKTYTGSKITQDLTVFYDGEPLVDKTDYTVAYKNNTNTGKAIVTITGKGDYDGKKNYEFNILPADIADAAVEVNAVTDTGTAKKPAVKATVSYLGKKLTNKDFTVEVDWNSPEVKQEKVTVKKVETEIEVTYYPVKIKATTVPAKGKTINFVGENTSAKLKVYPKGNKAVTDASYVNLKNGSIEIVGGNKYTYTGTSITPEIKVYAGKGDKKGEAIDPSSYKVTYSANTNKGTAKITVSGIESKGYMGSVSASFSIAALGITSDKISVKLDAKTPYSKGGAKPVPVVSIKLPDGSDKVLREGVDYTLSYANNAAAGVTGDKTPKLTITGKGNLSGKRTAGFVIETKDIASVKIVTKDKEVKANAKGDYFKSKPELYDIDGKKLAENKDYTVAYFTADSKEIDKTTVLEDGATVTVNITGKGNYTGEVTATYSIRKIYDLSKTAYDKIADKQYTGKAIRPDNEIKLYTKTGSGKQIKKEYLTTNDYEVLTCFNNVKKGTATYILKGKGRFSGYKVITFKIVKAKFM